MGHDTLQEEHMLGVAWEFYRKGADYGAGSLLRSRTNHFEMYARFFVLDQIGRKVHGLYAFLRDAPTILMHRNVFWPRGHPSDPNVDLRQCVFNVELLAENVRWYVDYETRFWNTLEFLLDQPNAAFAASLLDDYCKWLEVQGLGRGTGYLRESVPAFDQKAMETAHPFFTNKAGRLDPSLWQNGAANSSAMVVRRESPSKRRNPSNLSSPNGMPIDISNEEAEAKLQAEARKQLALSSVASLVDIAPGPSPPSDEQSMQLEPVASSARTLLRTIPVPQYGDNQGQAPTLAYVYANSISLKGLGKDGGPMAFTPPSGLSNTGDNLLSIVYNSVARENKPTDKQIILTMLRMKNNIPTLLVVDTRFVDGKKGNKTLETPMVSARPSDCCVSWDGLRIVVNDRHTDGSFWLGAVDLVPDDKIPAILMAKVTTTASTHPIVACTRSLLATYTDLHHGDMAALKNTRLKLPQDPDLKFVSASTNAWIQPNQLLQEIQEARRHTAFVHLYERKDGTHLAVVTPLNEDGTQAEVDKTFSVPLRLPNGAPPRSINDTMVPRVLWYPLPSYAVDAYDQLRQHNIDESKDQALMVWCVHRDLTLVMTAPAPDQDLNNYVPPVTLAVKYTPTPILNNLSLQMFDRDFTPVNILDFSAIADLLAP